MPEQGYPTARWLLPDGIGELLPEDASRLEALRRRLLDTCASWGYQQVVPPLIEFLDSLLTGAGHDLELQTFKLTDPLSGRLLGVRADMTPQVARIDAHNLKQEQPTRLSYVGTVLRAFTDPLEKYRSPVQLGAELYGYGGMEADLEVIRLMLEVLAQAGVLEVHLDLGHVGIYRGLAAQAGLSRESEAGLFEILQRKSRPDLEDFLAHCDCSESGKQALASLLDLNGTFEVVETAQQLLSHVGAGVSAALETLRQVAEQLRRQYRNLPIHFDLAELRGYHYHTGLVFAAFVPGHGREIARGGRYDDIGRAFGRARPAVGFSTDLKQLLRLGQCDSPPTVKRVMAPAGEAESLLETIRQLRTEGWMVVQLFPGQADEPEKLGCHHRLEFENGRYRVKPIG